MSRLTEPCPSNEYLRSHVELLITSYRNWTGKALLSPELSHDNPFRSLFEAPFGLVSHNTDRDPVFNYANQTAMRLFDMSWSEFTRLPSRLSAEATNREERSRLMQRVTQEGFIDDYRGVRISARGRRFEIIDATVWNVVDAKGEYRGQAAVFHHWQNLSAV